MPVYLLNEEPIFPPVIEADPDGLIAIGGDLSIPRLLNAYSVGIFPWFEQEELIFWFSPDPRLILFPEKIKISRSLSRTIKSTKFEIRVDTAFRQVITACSKAIRPEQDGTWINRKFINAYVALHKAGYAHSIEVFHEGILSGGLYGLSLGSAFFGESMFQIKTDASKVAFWYLSELAKKIKLKFIDCQVESGHLLRLGAELISRAEYLGLLTEAMTAHTVMGNWKMDDKDWKMDTGQ